MTSEAKTESSNNKFQVLHFAVLLDGLCGTVFTHNSSYCCSAS